MLLSYDCALTYCYVIMDTDFRKSPSSYLIWRGPLATSSLARALRSLKARSARFTACQGRSQPFFPFMPGPRCTAKIVNIMHATPQLSSTYTHVTPVLWLTINNLMKNKNEADPISLPEFLNCNRKLLMTIHSKRGLR